MEAKDNNKGNDKLPKINIHSADESKLNVTGLIGVGVGLTTSQQKGQQGSELTRTLSDSDIRSSRRRTHSNLSQCKRSRAHTRNHVDFSTARSSSLGHGPRPTPVGMSFDTNEDYSNQTNSSEWSTNDSLSISQSLDYGFVLNHLFIM